MTERRTSAPINDPVIRHVRHDFARLLADQTVGQCLEGLRHQSPSGRIIYFYVTDGCS
jgi:Mg/Co/Ni transporter MgtE